MIATRPIITGTPATPSQRYGEIDTSLFAGMAAGGSARWSLGCGRRWTGGRAPVGMAASRSVWRLEEGDSSPTESGGEPSQDKAGRSYAPVTLPASAARWAALAHGPAGSSAAPTDSP